MMTQQTLYEQSCEALRHYSNLIFQVRAIGIAQGIIILSAPYIMLDNNDEIIFYAINLFGIGFTAILGRLQNNYIEDFESHLSKIDILEGHEGTYTNYKKSHERKHQKNWEFRTFTRNGIFWFIGIMFLLKYLFIGIPDIAPHLSLDMNKTTVCFNEDLNITVSTGGPKNNQATTYLWDDGTNSTTAGALHRLNVGNADCADQNGTYQATTATAETHNDYTIQGTLTVGNIACDGSTGTHCPAGGDVTTLGFGIDVAGTEYSNVSVNNNDDPHIIKGCSAVITATNIPSGAVVYWTPATAVTPPSGFATVTVSPTYTTNYSAFAISYVDNEYGCCSKNDDTDPTSEITVHVDDYKLVITSTANNYLNISQTNYAQFKDANGNVSLSIPSGYECTNSFKWYTRSGSTWTLAATYTDNTTPFISHCYNYDDIKVECDIDYILYPQNNCTLSCTKTCSMVRNGPNREEESSTIKSSPYTNVYPNPNEGAFYLSINDFSNSNNTVTLFLTDMSGKEIWFSEYKEENGMLNNYIRLPGWITNGIYILEIRSLNGTCNKKIIVQK